MEHVIDENFLKAFERRPEGQKMASILDRVFAKPKATPEPSSSMVDPSFMASIRQ